MVVANPYPVETLCSTLWITQVMHSLPVDNVYNIAKSLIHKGTVHNLSALPGSKPLESYDMEKSEQQ